MPLEKFPGTSGEALFVSFFPLGLEVTPARRPHNRGDHRAELFRVLDEHDLLDCVNYELD